MSTGHKPPETSDAAVTLNDPKQNQPPPTETSSKNKPVAEECEATSTQSSEAKTERNDTTPPPKKSSSLDKLKPPFKISNLLPKCLLRKKSQSSKSFDAKSRDEKELKKAVKHTDEISSDIEEDLASKLIKAIEKDFQHTEEGVRMLREYQNKLTELWEKIKGPNDEEQNKKLMQDLIRLNLAFPLKVIIKPDGAVKNFHFSPEFKKQVSLDMMPQLHNVRFFERSPAFKDFEARYKDLDPNVKLCLLCFSVFPDNEIVKKRVMVQWWLVERFALDEKEANENFVLLIDKGFVEAVNESRSLSVGSCRMHPFHRSALVMIAHKARFLNFGPKGEPTQNFAGCYQSCLVGEGLISYEDLMGGSVSIVDLKKVHLVINISETVLEFKRGWLSKMINLNVLYLGRWETSATGHREVEEGATLFLDELKNMKYLKLLNLQGVSNLTDLPESVMDLTNLEILDIRGCYNLRSIPEDIGNRLQFLTHLDMSDCYLLDHMPKTIVSLKGLRVLKGFVVGQGKKSCKLKDLNELKNLVKLCVCKGLREFPRKEDVRALNSLEGLKKLTITWEGSAFIQQEEEYVEEETNVAAGLPLGLEKLDLRNFPKSTTPEWLKIGKLKELKKLYIRGGKFSDLGQYQDSDSWEWPLEMDTWRVEVLRLRYLLCIEMEWSQVQELFPQLLYLEQVSCPKLSFFPCDANGVWMK